MKKSETQIHAEKLELDATLVEALARGNSARERGALSLLVRAARATAVDVILLIDDAEMAAKEVALKKKKSRRTTGGPLHCRKAS